MGYANKVLFISVAGFFPGVGHMYLGRKKKALSLFIVFIGLVAGFILSDLMLVRVLIAMVYLSISVPAWLETYQIARYGHNIIDTDARWYTVVMLLLTGFTALPLLWQNGNFSKRSKILWSIAVPVLAAVFLP